MMPLLLAALAAAPAQDTVRLDLEEAVARALAVSPRVAAAEGRVAAPRGERAEALWPFPSNPVLELGTARRESPTETRYDRELRVRLPVEVSGRNFVRRSAAGKRVTAAERRVDDARRVVSLEARLAYVELALAERRVALLDSAATFAERLAEVARRQREAGEIGRLELNAALLEGARQRSAAERALADLGAAAVDLARLLAIETDSVPRTVGLPPVPDARLPDDSVLIEIASRRRPDLQAADFELRGARQDVTAATLGLVPSLDLVGFTAREEDADLLGVSVGLSVPLFHRQQSERGIERAERAAARAELGAARRRVRADVRAAAARYRAARSAERRFEAEVLQAATENVGLAERAFEAGKVGIAEVILLRTAAVSTQLEYLDVLREAHRGWFGLAAALDMPPGRLDERLGGAAGNGSDSDDDSGEGR